FFVNQPTPEQIALEKAKRDSIEASVASNKVAPVAPKEQVATISTDTIVPDSVKNLRLKEQWGEFSNAVTGKEEFFTLENKKLKVTVTSKGGRIKSAILKEYKTWDGRPVELLGSDSSSFNITFSAGNRIINTQDLFFQSYRTPGSKNSASFRLAAGDGKFLEFNYALPEDSYLLDFSIRTVGMQDVIATNATYLNLDWKDQLRRQEKSVESERIVSTVYYRFTDDEVDYLSETEDERESLKTKVKWVSFKQHFFNTTLISDQSFDSPVVETFTDKESKDVVKMMSASIALPFNRENEQKYGMRFYIGPNHYQTLKSIDDLGMEKLIPLGWGIFGWVNKFLVIPTFNYLKSFNLNDGLIILRLTVLCRILILPLPFSSFYTQSQRSGL
ncbi:MAG: membrane protein insertase YidC, partial [Bacteroidota bacterium]